MKKSNLLSFLLGGLVFISFAAATTSIMEVKPTPPTSVYVTSGWADDLVRATKEYVKKGYIVKTVTFGNGVGILVMEKY